MRLISIVGLVFIPFTAITSVFGTQFFVAQDEHMAINPDFWVLWVIAIPVTLLILAMWRVTEQDDLKWPLESAGAHMPRWWSAAQRSTRRNRGSSAVTGGTGFELRDMGSQGV